MYLKILEKENINIPFTKVIHPCFGRMSLKGKGHSFFIL
ncbi:hypothetical protein BCH308197_1315 [Bacillus cereus H3081.97]|nr:hypothetical protein BCH308197_1315 [Bacillus cereus H3081.97]